MNRAKTPWFPRNVKPVRPGVYERLFGADLMFARWDGRWFVAHYTVDLAARSTNVSGFQSRPWRGLANTPKGVRT